MLLYEDLLAIPPKPEQPPVDLKALEQQQATEDSLTIQEAERRLLQTYPDVPPQILNEVQQHAAQNNLQSYHGVLMRAQAIVAQLEEMRELAMKGSDAEGKVVAGPSRISVPISVLSVKECEALVRVCVREWFSLVLNLTDVLWLDESPRWAQCVPHTRNHEGTNLPPQETLLFTPPVAFWNADTRKHSNRYPRNPCYNRQHPGHRITHRKLHNHTHRPSTTPPRQSPSQSHTTLHHPHFRSRRPARLRRKSTLRTNPNLHLLHHYSFLHTFLHRTSPSLGPLLSHALRRTPKPRRPTLHTHDPRLRLPTHNFPCIRA